MSVIAFAPASIGNFSVGFDILGLAIQPEDGSPLGDTVHVTASDHPENQLVVKGRFSSKLPANKDNIVWDCLNDFNQEIQTKNITPSNVCITLDKGMPVGSGLGSSACSIVATLVALNAHYQHPLSKKKLLHLMGKGEARITGSLHYDNVAPSFLGGLQLILSQTSHNNEASISQTLPLIKEWSFVVAYSGISVSTRDAREVLPSTYPLTTITQQTQTLAAFLTGLYSQDSKQALSHIKDWLAEPYRSHLLPGFIEAKQHLLDHGAKTVGISGSGPTLFSIFTDSHSATQATQWLRENYLNTQEGFVHKCHCDHQGAWFKQENNG